MNFNSNLLDILNENNDLSSNTNTENIRENLFNVDLRIINSNIIDISNTEDISNILNILNNFRNAINTNLTPTIETNYDDDNDNDNFINNFINDTFNANTNKKYQQVIDDEEYKNLKRIKYKKEEALTKNYNNDCPIYCTTFKEDDDIIELPCNHIYIPSGIEKWLTKESNTCPICRYEFKNKEIEIDQDQDTDPSATAPILEENIPNIQFNNLQNNNFTNILMNIINNTNNPYNNLYYNEEIALQEALLENFNNDNSNNIL